MGNLNKLTKVLLGATALTVISAGTAYADGTAAGTEVSNTFTLDYNVGGTAQPTIDTSDAPGGSDTPTLFTVDRLVDLTVASTGDTTVAPGATDEELVFSVTNLGNGTQGYVLDLQDGVDGSDDIFDATGVTVTYYFESGDTVGFDAADEAGTAFTYTPGSGLATQDIPADGIIWVVVSGDIDSGQDDADTSEITLVADTVVGGAPGVAGVQVNADTGGNILTGAGSEENVLADLTGSAATGDVDGDGAHSATGTYIVASADLTASKAVSIFDEDATVTECRAFPGTAGAGNQYSIPGACVEYTISATNSGATAAATDIVISDTLPTELTYENATFDATNFTGTATFNTPTQGTDCNATACTVSLSGVSLAAGATGTVTIRAFVK